MKRLLVGVLAGLLFWPPLGLAEPARMSKADVLYEKAFTDAKLLLRLERNQPLEILARSGSWYRVKVAGQSGWVRMLSVRRTAAAAAVSAGSLAQVATGRAGSGQIVSTTGVRGLEEEALRTAGFSEAALAAAERFRVARLDAERQAGQAGLVPRAVPPLPAVDGKVTP